MKLRFVLIGKPHSSYFEEAYGEYRKRLLKYADATVVYAKEAKLGDNPTPTQIQKALDQEGESVLKSLNRNDFLIVLDLRGKEQDSERFASDFSKICESHASVVFVIGSSYGISPKLRERADYLLKLSELTFTHPLALLVILEQTYRAFKIARGETYQK